MTLDENNVTIEDAVIGDAFEILEIERSLFQEPWSLPMIQEEILNESGEFYCLRNSGGELVGYGGYYVVGGDEGHITNLGIKEEYQGRGLATRLLVALIKSGPIHGVSRFTLEVRRNNIAAIDLYSKFGFYQDGIRKNYYPVSGEDALIFWTPFIDSEEYKTLIKTIELDINYEIEPEE